MMRFDKYLAHHRSRWVGMTNRFLARLRIDKADLDGEGAVDLTFAKFYRESDRGRLISINDSVDFQKQMTVHLKRVIGDEYKRSQAIKRVGDGMSRSKKTDKPSGTATINRADGLEAFGERTRTWTHFPADWTHRRIWPL